MAEEEQEEKLGEDEPQHREKEHDDVIEDFPFLFPGNLWFSL